MKPFISCIFSYSLQLHIFNDPCFYSVCFYEKWKSFSYLILLYQIAKNQLEWKFLLWYENQDSGRNNEGTRAIYYNSPHDHGLGRHPYIFLPGANLWASVKIPLHTQETPSEKKC